MVSPQVLSPAISPQSMIFQSADIPDITKYLDEEELDIFEDAFMEADMNFLEQLMKKHSNNQKVKELIFGSFYSLSENPRLT